VPENLYNFFFQQRDAFIQTNETSTGSTKQFGGDAAHQRKQRNPRTTLKTSKRPSKRRYVVHVSDQRLQRFDLADHRLQRIDVVTENVTKVVNVINVADVVRRSKQSGK
jgi:hypothetical protein